MWRLGKFKVGKALNLYTFISIGCSRGCETRDGGSRPQQLHVPPGLNHTALSRRSPKFVRGDCGISRTDRTADEHDGRRSIEPYGVHRGILAL